MAVLKLIEKLADHADADVAEHRDARGVVKLQADGSCFWPLRVPGVFAHELPVAPGMAFLISAALVSMGETRLISIINIPSPASA